MREARLETFVGALAQAVAARAPAGSPVDRLQQAIFDHAAVPMDNAARFPTRSAEKSEVEPIEAFVSPHLDAALTALEGRDDDLRAVAKAFRALAGDLVWTRRPAAVDEAPGFRDAHANATLIGMGGLEVRDDIRIGASLVAPAMSYPAHRHPPEELYLVLSDGEWRNSNQDWWRPGLGGLVHNPPGIEHAMRAGKAPLFAIWCLLIDAEN